MAEVVEMPKMSDTMEEGVIVAWHVNVGDTVKAGQLLAEVETDKATMELESYVSGQVLHIGPKVGDGVPVGSLILIVGKPGEDIQGLLAGKGGSQTAAPAAPTAPTAPAAVQPTAPVAPATAPAAPTAADAGRIKASPLAKAIATEKGIDLSTVAGSGDGGRIVKRDLETLQPSAHPAPLAKAPATAPAPGLEYEELPVSQMRKTIARRLSESKFTAPHFYLTLAIHMDAAAEFRAQLNADGARKISFNDLIVKACASALRKHPAVNSSWLGDRIRRNHSVNIGVAVAIEDGLIVPVIRNANGKGLEEISAETRSLAERARNRELQPQDWEGNTFTISNLGMFGIESFTAIINPPDSCILAVGGIQDEPVVKNGALAVAKVMRVTLSCDHRAVDGATGAQFLQTLKDYLESPMKMLL
ncbi:MAG: pyruvate dehydrogenase complex dihydrolipoamide acetyltransferase [Bacteroidia bacterium]|nr:pyruvate dehydrogenase complex dihydrolipoamide acetyltransferase [Bacteroidia bacterium]